MIDFTPITEKKTNWTRFSAMFCKQDLADQTIWLTDHILELIADATDFDAVFEPVDPDAHDPYADDPEDEALGWNLAHVIVHLTASNEESAFLAAELARGVEFEYRRSRWEVPWETVTTIEQVRARLDESRRILLSSLDMWPNEAHTENFYRTDRGLKITPAARFLLGQNHALQHIGQIKDILAQARAARETA